MSKWPDFHNLILDRRSIRRFCPDPVPQDVLDRILDAARLAPSAHNGQPWRIVVLSDTQIREQLHCEMQDKYRLDLKRDGIKDTEIERILRRSAELSLNAPIAILLCMSMKDMQVYEDADRNRAEHTMAVQSTALAGGQLMLAARAEGLGTCWICSPLFARSVVKKVLDLPGDWDPQAMILVGFPDSRPGPRRLKSIEEIMLWR